MKAPPSLGHRGCAAFERPRRHCVPALAAVWTSGGGGLCWAPGLQKAKLRISTEPCATTPVSCTRPRAHTHAPPGLGGTSVHPGPPRYAVRQDHPHRLLPARPVGSEGQGLCSSSSPTDPRAGPGKVLVNALLSEQTLSWALLGWGSGACSFLDCNVGAGGGARKPQGCGEDEARDHLT